MNTDARNYFPRNVIKKVWAILTVFLIFALLILLFIRFIWGPGQNNPVYLVTGIYIGKVIYFTLYLIGFALLLNKAFWKFIKKLFLSSKYLSVANSSEFATKPWSILSFASFANFILIAALYFRNKSNNVFIGVDGDYLQSVNANQESWGAGFFELGVNPLQGLGGNIWFPLNTRSDPGYLLGRLPGNFDYLLAHIGWAALLYLSAFFLARRLSLKQEVVILSAWIVPFFIIFPSVLQFSTVPQLIPHMSTIIALNTFMLAILITPRKTVKNAIYEGLMFTICILGILIINPSFLILCIPLNLFIFIASLKMHLSRRLGHLFLLTFGAPIGLLALLTVSYLLGIFKYSAASMYSDQFIVGIKSNRAISSFFQLPGTALTISISLIAMILVIYFHKSKAFIELAKSTLILFCCLMSLGFFYVSNPEIWDGPSPNYFEFVAWPMYGIFFSLVTVVILGTAIDFARRHIRFLRAVSEVNIVLSLIIVTALAASFVAIPTQRYWDFPSKENKILEGLQVLAVSPGSKFKGREMTFTGLNLTDGISWNDLQKNDYAPIISEFGTDFRKADLWIRSIPTLTEYSQTITPTSYRLLLALLGKAGDKQVRNILTLRRVNSSALAMLGVTLIVTDKKFKNLELLETLKSKTNLIYLYKISEPNLGDYSPTQVIESRSNFYILNQMTNMYFDPKMTIFVSENLKVSNVQRASSNKLIGLRNGYRVSASSAGSSIVLLPIEYSSCWSITTNDPKSATPKMFRANYGLTGLVFSNSMDIDLVYRYNLFANQSCRLVDLQKVK